MTTLSGNLPGLMCERGSCVQVRVCVCVSACEARRQTERAVGLYQHSALLLLVMTHQVVCVLVM